MNNLSAQVLFSKNVYMDLDNSSAIIVQDNNTLIRQNINSGEIYVFTYECNDYIIRLIDRDSGYCEHYYYKNTGNIVFCDAQGNEAYDYFPADNKYDLLGYKDLMDNEARFNLNVNECWIAEFGEYRFLVSDDKIYQAELQTDSIVVKNNGEDYYYYQINQVEYSTVYGNYTTTDALGVLVLREDGTGNLTLDMKGLNFKYTVYDKYLKCVDNGGTVFLIPYSISDTGMELTITIENESSSKMITFYRLRDIPES